jgi:hypothetical protein
MPSLTGYRATIIARSREQWRAEPMSPTTDCPSVSASHSSAVSALLFLLLLEELFYVQGAP